MSSDANVKPQLLVPGFFLNLPTRKKHFTVPSPTGLKFTLECGHIFACRNPMLRAGCAGCSPYGDCWRRPTRPSELPHSVNRSCENETSKQYNKEKTTTLLDSKERYWKKEGKRKSERVQGRKQTNRQIITIRYNGQIFFAVCTRLKTRKSTPGRGIQVHKRNARVRSGKRNFKSKNVRLSGGSLVWENKWYGRVPQGHTQPPTTDVNSPLASGIGMIDRLIGFCLTIIQPSWYWASL